MRRHYIKVADKWAVIFAYDIGLRDLDEIGDWLDALGASESDIRRASQVIMGTNTGFTFSNPNLKMSVTCISDASDDAQWWDTVVHEIDHVQKAICSHYDVPLGTEDAAYLQGYIMRQIVALVKFCKT